MVSAQEIYAKVTSVLVEALGVDEDDIKPTTTLQGNLGAESIDLLDIIFRLEHEFGFNIPRGELFPDAIFQGGADMVRDGKVTDKGLTELRARLPYADLSGFAGDRRLSAVPDLFTVGLVTDYVAWKLSQSSASDGRDRLPVPFSPRPKVPTQKMEEASNDGRQARIGLRE